MAIDPMSPGGVGPVKPGGEGSRTQGNTPADGPDFKAFLRDNLERVNQMQLDADQAVEGLLTGKETDITKVMGAVEKADVAFQTLMAVRNKLVESYQEILRMRI